MFKLNIILIIIGIIVIFFYIIKNKNKTKDNNISRDKNISKDKNIENFSEDIVSCRKDIKYETTVFEACISSLSNENSLFYKYDNINDELYVDRPDKIIETKNYVFVLTESMTKIYRASKIDFNFIEVFNTNNINKVNTDNPLINEYNYIYLIAPNYKTDECYLYIKKIVNYNNTSTSIPTFKDVIYVVRGFGIIAIEINSGLENFNIIQKFIVKDNNLFGLFLEKDENNENFVKFKIFDISNDSLTEKMDNFYDTLNFETPYPVIENTQSTTTRYNNYFPNLKSDLNPKLGFLERRNIIYDNFNSDDIKFDFSVNNKRICVIDKFNKIFIYKITKNKNIISNIEKESLTNSIINNPYILENKNLSVVYNKTVTNNQFNVRYNLISDIKVKPTADKTFNFSVKNYSNDNDVPLTNDVKLIDMYLDMNLFCIIEDNSERHIYHYYHKHWNEDLDKYDDEYKPLITDFYFKIDSYLNPVIKFEYGDNISKIVPSFFNWFENNFKNKQEWIDLYKTICSIGYYSPNPQYPYNIKTNNFNFILKDIIDSYIDHGLNQNQLNKLKTIKNTKIYDYNLDKSYPQLILFKLNDIERTKNCDNDCQDDLDNKYFIHINFNPNNIDENLILKEGFDNIKFLGLFEQVQTETDKILDNYKRVEITDYSKYYRLKEQGKDDFYIINCTNNENYYWTKKKICNFRDFYSIVTGNIMIEDISKDRVRGLFNIDYKYIDDEYEKLINTRFRDNQENKLIREFINEIENIDKEEKGYGYPFVVIYKEYSRIPPSTSCLGKRTKDKIFLTTNILKKHVEDNEIYLDKDNRIYPFVKQEYLSFSGLGNDIKFYENKIGKFVSFTPKGNCPITTTSAPSYCDNTCPTVIAPVDVSGRAKCDLNTNSSAKKPTTPIHLELIGRINKYACSVYQIKGDHRLYYNLSRIFKKSIKGDYQMSNIFTIKSVEKVKYLYFDGNNIIDKDSFEYEDKENYLFEGEVNIDNYGPYFLFRPINSSFYLTRRLNIFTRQFETSNTSQWKLEIKKNNLDNLRNIKNQDQYKNDLDYYSQKFIVPKSLLLSIVAQDKTDNKIINEMSRENILKENMICKLRPESCTGKIDEELIGEEIKEDKLLDNVIEDIEDYMKINTIDIQFDNQINMLKEVLKKLKSQPIVQPTTTKITPTKKFSLNTNLSHLVQDYNFIPESEDKSEPKKDPYFRFNLAQKIKQLKKKLYENNNMIDTFENPKQYKDLPENHLHSSDEFRKYLIDTIHKLKDQLNIKTKLKNNLQIINEDKLHYNENKRYKLEIINEIEKQNKNNFKRNVKFLKNTEINSRLNKLEKEIENLNNLKKNIIKDEKKNKNNLEQYHSILSQEDNHLLNIYNLQKSDYDDASISCNTPTESCYDENKDNNLVFVNNKCLKYNQGNNELETEHCNINDPSFHFTRHNIKNDENLQKSLNDKGIKFGLDNLVSKDFNIFKSNDKCLHKDKNGLSLRPCNNVSNQRWNYSKISGPCK